MLWFHCLLYLICGESSAALSLRHFASPLGLWWPFSEPAAIKVSHAAPTRGHCCVPLTSLGLWAVGHGDGAAAVPVGTLICRWARHTNRNIFPTIKLVSNRLTPCKPRLPHKCSSLPWTIKHIMRQINFLNHHSLGSLFMVITEVSLIVLFRTKEK